MTEAEAMEILIRDDDEMRKGYFCLNDFEALEIAKNALEKQIPKKPRESVKFGDTITIRCSNCNIATSFYEGFEYDYCPRCGQKLDSEV